MIRFTFSAAALAAVLALGPQTASAQEISHKQADDFAAWLVTDGQYAKAAKLYADAYEEKSRSVHAYQAAELYSYVKDYQRAAVYYGAVLDNSEYPDAGLKIARCYQRMAQFDAARKAYNTVLSNYHEADSANVYSVVKLELAGVDFAEAELTRVDPTVFVDRLGQSINGMKSEIAPMVTSKGVLNFISDFDGTMRAYSSELGRHGWGQMKPSDDLPVIDEGHIGGGTLVNADRFYFSICDQAQQMTQPAVACQIFVAIRRGGQWGDPKPLPANINVDGATAVQPFVFENEGLEVMIFASDRAGGEGGLDLWRTERALDSENSVFGTPVNLGPAINGPGNEATPFFNTETRVLSFSSDGGRTLGGYDILHATATEGIGKWSEVINPGTPVNSSGDDYHYREVVGTSKAYFSSNRSDNMSRTSLNNENIYEVSYDSRNVSIEFVVLDDATGRPVSDPTITVSLNPDGRMRKPLTTVRSIDGTYTLTLPVERDVTIDISRPYFDDQSLRLVVPDDAQDGHEVDATRLERSAIAADDAVVVVEGSTTRSSSQQAVEPEVMTANGEELESN